MEPPKTTLLKLCPALEDFANTMQSNLKNNRHKGGWNDDKCSLSYLLTALKEEVEELEEALRLIDKCPERVMCEAADVANFAMMLHDRHHANNHGSTKT